MRKLFVFVLLLCATAPLFSQESYFPTTKGTRLEYADYNNKGKISTYTIYNITETSGTPTDMTVTYVMSAMTADRQQVVSDLTTKVDIIEGDVYFDVNSMFASTTSATGDGTGITYEGDGIYIPAQLSEGMELPDSECSLTLNIGIKMTTRVKITDRKVLAKESVTTPAGTFECYKVTQTSTTTVLRKPVTSTQIQWLTPNIGTVKQEIYDNKGKLTTSAELISVSVE